MQRNFMQKSNYDLFKTTKRVCRFCRDGIDYIDYKDVNLLQKFLSPYCQILPRRKTGICQKHQKKLAQAIKRARYLALLPYVRR
jgi:small subunit ribosomal protein S18